MSNYQSLNNDGQQLIAFDGDVIQLPDTNTVSNGFKGYVYMKPDCTSVQLVPVSNQTIDSLSGTQTLSKPKTLTNRIITLTKSSSNWSVSIEEDSYDDASTSVPLSSDKIEPSNSSSSSSSPFAPAGFAPVSTLNHWYGLAASPDGLYVYVAGDLVAGGNGAVVKVKLSDGSIAGTCDFGSGDTANQIAISPDSAYVYAQGGASRTKWWKIRTSDMTLTHTSTLAVASVSGRQPFDLSPDGTVYAYVSGADANLYMIDTTTYVETNQTMNHTAGNLTAVCFYNGSNSDVYVAHAGSADVDKYSTAGVYDSTVSTGAGGTPNFTAMRSGINSTFYIADQGDNQEVIAVVSGTPTKFATGNAPSGLSLANASSMAAGEANDVCVFRANNSNTSNGSPLYAIANYSADLVSIPVPMPVDYNNDRLSSPVLSPDGTRVFGLGGVNYPTVWSVPLVVSAPPAKTAGWYPTSDGQGNWTADSAPYSTSGWSGNDTIGGGGSVTITTSVATASSKIMVTNTSATPQALSIQNKGSGTFDVVGTAADTFDWVIIKP